MEDKTIIKVTAIISLTILEIVNLVVAHLDGNILLSVGVIIGGIAGYEFGRHKE